MNFLVFDLTFLRHDSKSWSSFRVSYPAVSAIYLISALSAQFLYAVHAGASFIQSQLSWYIVYIGSSLATPPIPIGLDAKVRLPMLSVCAPIRFCYAGFCFFKGGRVSMVGFNGSLTLVDSFISFLTSSSDKYFCCFWISNSWSSRVSKYDLMASTASYDPISKFYIG